MNDADRVSEEARRARVERYIARKTTELSNSTSREDIQGFWTRCRAQNVRLGTMQTYAAAFARAAKHSLGRPFRDFTRVDALRVMSEIQASANPNTAACIARCMITFFRWLREDEPIPLSFLRAWRVQARSPTIPVITEAERDALLAAAAQSLDERFIARNQALIWCLWDSGYRKSELLALCHGDLQFMPDGTVRARQGDDAPRLKTGPRTAYFGTAAQALKLLLTICPGGASDPVFANLRHAKFAGHRMSGNELSRVLAELSRVAGIRHIRPHIFRHTAATRAAEHGATGPDLEQRFWTVGSAMSKIYLHMREGRLAAAARAELGVTDLGAPASDSRPCPACAEPVKVAASKCKHCSEWISTKAGPKK